VGSIDTARVASAGPSIPTEQKQVYVSKIQSMPQRMDSALSELLANHLSPSFETAPKLFLFSLLLSLQTNEIMGHRNTDESL